MKRVVLLLALAWAAPAAAQVAAEPMHAKGGALPRLVRFPDAQMRTRVNALLAGREAEERAARQDCRRQVHDAGLGDEAYFYEDDAEVTYLSPRYMSLRIVASWNCGGAHPDGETKAITFDLGRGAPLDWQKVFKPGFKEGLRKLYQARYSSTDAACRDAVKNDFPGDMALWLDRGKGGLTVEPQFAHAIQSCADDITFAPTALAPLVADAELLADLNKR